MKNINDISEELSSMGSPLAGLSRAMPYTVPDGFFNDFPAALQSTVTELSKPDIVPDWGKTHPFGVPDGYFEALTDDIVANVRAASLSKDMPFAAPAGYFEAFPAHILNTAKAADNVAKETKVIPLKSRKLFMPVRWAAAAVLLICICIGSFEMFFNQPAVSSDKILASVPGDEIHEYMLRTYRFDIDRVVGSNDVNNLQIDNRDIIQYLNETGWDIVD